MKTCWLISGAFVLGLVIGTGFTYRIKKAENEPLSSVRNLDYFISDDSFSEVHNAKAVLTGLSRKFLTELRSRAWIEAQENRADPHNPGKNTVSAPGLILALERGIDEFKGTEHELRLIPDLLRALKANGLRDRWLEIYLTALYTHPTDEVVLTFAREAVQMGTRTGRQDEVADALRHVCTIPITFPSKSDLQSKVLQLLPRPSVVQKEDLLKDWIVAKRQKLLFNTIDQTPA